MVFKSRLGSLLLVSSFVTTASFAAHAQSPSAPADAGQPVTVTIPSTAIDSAIKDYLRRNPEVVNDAMVNYQAKLEAKRQADAEASITSKSAEIYQSKSPVAGNPNGTETIVEFFDYNCHYCKQEHPDLQSVVKADANVKVIYKDLPILTPGSMTAAKAALAAQAQGKYLELHDAFLDYKGTLDDASVKQVAESVGLDWDKLKTDMEKPEITQQIQDNRALADQLDIHGTPTMIVNKKLVNGALPMEELKKRLDDKG